MTDEQVWEDLSRFALAMKRGATVVMNDGAVRCRESGQGMDFRFIRDRLGIREIIEPPQKKIRPLNAEEWKGVAGCIIVQAFAYIPVQFFLAHAQDYAAKKSTCHPPGFPNDVRKLWVEE